MSIARCQRTDLVNVVITGEIGRSDLSSPSQAICYCANGDNNHSYCHTIIVRLTWPMTSRAVVVVCVVMTVKVADVVISFSIVVVVISSFIVFSTIRVSVVT